MEDKARSKFTGKIGFVLAAAGSAVGLGNIWRFPYLAAQHGGGIFLLVYIILAVTFGFALMCAEIAIGRKTGKSAISAYGKLDKRYGAIGLAASAVPIIVLSYYAVIGGWVTKYFTAYISGNGASAASEGFFTAFRGGVLEPIGWLLLFLALTAAVVLLGVEKGIEKISKIMMPVLVVLTVAIAVYAMTLDGAMEGVRYYLTPDFSKFSINTVLAAMGQLFYSTSLSMGIMITYGSYMKKDVSIESSVKQIELFDTGVAFLAGLMVIPAVFAFSGGDESKLGQGPGLMFETLPKVFDSVGGAGGQIIGALFFVMVLFAALTSSISLMETVVSIFRDRFGWSRRLACFAVFALCIVIGLPSALGYSVLDGISLAGMTVLDMLDTLVNSIIMPLVALATSLFVGFVIKPAAISEEIELSGVFKRKRMFSVLIKFVAPICIVLILVSSVLNIFGVISL